MGILKRLTRRELSPRQLKLAEEEFAANFWVFLLRRQNVYCTRDGEPERRVVWGLREKKNLIDFLCRRSSPYYNLRTVSYRYNEDGMLLEKNIQRGSRVRGSVKPDKIISYNPPGSWSGKDATKTNRTYLGV